ncbi:aminoglycoside adenylyltransferase domain-containing protein [Heyndrickxia sp. NPDC080065]|uniref:aminoglycoside adenylyltransferase domain-containing protein n=1 Tax=Heyndrickxia sp. NPDC080065 TaxID=3390568 RepID=UPI003CFC8948
MNEELSVNEYLKKVTSLFQNQLGSNLIGIYLHGSLAMGCFHPELSDVDILVVIKERLSKEKKKNIIQDILQLEEYKLEMSILLEKDVVDFKHPTPFELHYSQMHRERYLQAEDYLCADSVDPDIAAHLVVTFERGKCLYGKPIRDVLKPIEGEYYLQSILFDIENAVQEIVHNPVYYTLNLCRVFFFLTDGVVSSKKEGGEWGMKVLPDRYKDLVSISLIQYIEPTSKLNWDNVLLIEFAEYMIEEIQSGTRGQVHCPIPKIENFF